MRRYTLAIRLFLFFILFYISFSSVPVFSVNDQNVEKLIQRLGDKDWEIRLGAKEELVKMGDNVLMPLIDALKEEKDTTIRIYLAWVLGEAGDRAAEEVLSQVVRKDPRQEVKISAKMALVDLGVESAKVIRAELGDLLENSKDVLLRRRAVKHLVQFGNRASRAALERALSREEVPIVRQEIIQGLTRLSQDSFPLLLKVLKKEKVPGLRREAVLALEKITLKEFSQERNLDRRLELMGKVISNLTVVLRNDKDDSVRQASASVVGNLIPPLLSSLGAAERLARRLENDSIVTNYKRLIKQGIEALIIRLKSDEVSLVRRAAALSLFKLPLKKQRVDTSFRESLRNDVASSLSQVLVNDEDAQVRKIVAQTLGKLGERLAVPNLVKALNTDADSEVRLEALTALGGLEVHRKEVVKAVLQRLNNEDEKLAIRRKAASVLGTIRAELAVPDLILIVLEKRNDSTLRAEAIGALGKIRETSAFPALYGATEDEEDEVRLAAAKALGESGDKEAPSFLVELALGDKNSSVRKVAITSIKSLEKK